MKEASTPKPGSGLPPSVEYESTPLTRTEYIMALVHLYRGELYRANSWRIRLDNTTNWAVLTSAGILSFTFSDPLHSHWGLLVGLLLISIFLSFEARRYRFADIWYVRVRKIEQNFYGPILRRDPVSPEALWGKQVAEDLLRPNFKISRLRALRSRLLHNYWPIYSVLIASWVVKVMIHPAKAQTWSDVQQRLPLGPLPWWLALAFLGAFVAAAVLVIFLAPPAPEGEIDPWSFQP